MKLDYTDPAGVLRSHGYFVEQELQRESHRYHRIPSVMRSPNASKIGAVTSEDKRYFHAEVPDDGRHVSIEKNLTAC